MEGTRTSQRVKTRRAIKEEPDDEEILSITPRKRRNTEDQGTITERQANSESESRETQTGGDGGRLSVKKQEEELEVSMEKRHIKTESDEEWSEDDEDEEEGDSDPDYDDDGCSSNDSGTELSKQRNDVNQNTRDWEFRATPDSPPDSLTFKPARTPGPVLDHTASWTPLSVFQLFCSSSVIRTLVKNTNKNGKKLQIESRRKKKWTDITFKDFYMYLSTVMFMSLVKLYDHCDYWKSKSPYDLPFPRKVMSRNLFAYIRIALCMCDPEKDEENESKKETAEYDKLFKVKPFYTELVNACKTHFQPYRNICVHERKVRKDKPLKCGFRVYALADSSTGYTWNFLINTGKSAGYTAVKNLLPLSTLGSGYTLYTDGPFSSPRLFTELLDKNISCCGILSPCHSGFPQNAQNDFTAPQASRGDIRWLRKDKLLFVKWMDTREVAMCSTVHEAFTGQVIRRPVRQGKGWVPKQFSCPDAVADFNRHMIVPRNFDFDFNMPCSRIEWSRILFYHLLDLAVVNSFILYKELLKLKGVAKAKDLKQKEFREELCREMYKFGKGCDPDDSDGPPPPPAASVLCMPVYFVLGNATAGRKLCKMCHKKTPVYCQKCLVPLCLTSSYNCFKEWHELESAED